MNYFLIVFTALMGFLCFYILNLQNANESLIKQNLELEIALREVSKAESEILEKQESLKKAYEAKSKRLESIEFKGGACEIELDSYRNLINAF